MNEGNFITHLLMFVMNAGVSKNSGTPKSSILIGFSIINHTFWGTSIFGNTHACMGHYWIPKTTEGFSSFGVFYFYHFPTRARARSRAREPSGGDCAL